MNSNFYIGLTIVILLYRTVFKNCSIVDLVGLASYSIIWLSLTNLIVG